MINEASVFSYNTNFRNISEKLQIFGSKYFDMNDFLIQGSERSDKIEPQVLSGLVLAHGRQHAVLYFTPLCP